MTIKNRAKLFIAYAHRDTALMHRLVNHLSALVLNKMIDPWTDGIILPGEIWDVRIREAIHHADIVLFLISADLLASNYVMNIEFPQALMRQQEGRCQVIPVFLRKCQTDGLNFGKFQGLPGGPDRPVTSFNDRDEAMYRVARGIWSVVEQLGRRKIRGRSRKRVG